MSTRPSRGDLRPQILEEASAWITEFIDGDVDGAQRVEFNRWIRRSPEHVRAYLEIAATWVDSVNLDSGRAFDPKQLVEEALAERVNNVVALSPREASAEPQTRTPSRSESSFPLRALAASALLAIAATSIWFVQQRNVYSTGTGEQRSVVLADGSTVQLNSRSRVRIDFSDSERHVELLQGQALFQVSKNPARPFIVRSADTSVRAVGTEFDVYRKQSGTTVTVIEGRVAVGSATTSTAPASRSSSGDAGAVASAAILLSAGEQVVVKPNLTPRPVRTNVSNATAWTQRKLVFEETPLAEAAQEFNRYNQRRVVIDDPGLQNLHVRGTFSSNDPELFVRFLVERFGMKVTESDGELRISREEEIY